MHAGLLAAALAGAIYSMTVTVMVMSNSQTLCTCNTNARTLVTTVEEIVYVDNVTHVAIAVDNSTVSQVTLDLTTDENVTVEEVQTESYYVDQSTSVEAYEERTVRNWGPRTDTLHLDTDGTALPLNSNHTIVYPYGGANVTTLADSADIGHRKCVTVPSGHGLLELRTGWSTAVLDSQSLEGTHSSCLDWDGTRWISGAGSLSPVWVPTGTHLSDVTFPVENTSDIHTFLSHNATRLFIGDTPSQVLVYDRNASGVWVQSAAITDVDSASLYARALTATGDGLRLAVAEQSQPYLWIYREEPVYSGTWVEESQLAGCTGDGGGSMYSNLAMDERGSTLVGTDTTGAGFCLYRRLEDDTWAETNGGFIAYPGALATTTNVPTLSHDGRRLVVAASYDANTPVILTYTLNENATIAGSPQQSFPNTTEGTNLTASAMSSDGRRLAVGFGDVANGQVHIFDYDEWDEEWEALGQILEPPLSGTGVTDFGKGLDISEDGRTLCVGSRTHTSSQGAAWCYFWHASARRFVLASSTPLTVNTTANCGRRLSLSGDGRTLALSCNTVHLFV